MVAREDVRENVWVIEKSVITSAETNSLTLLYNLGAR
jgi:hypothetical protein